MKMLELLNRSNLLSAHRGARAFYAENTLKALEMSVGHCDFMEVDVQLSRDKVALIMHDATLERTTNVKALEQFRLRAPYRVCDFTYEELCTLDYGSWFYEADPFHQIAQKKVKVPEANARYEPLLTLSELLRFIAEKQLFINIEIKDIHEDFEDEEVVEIVLEEIERWHVENLVVISSFRAAYLPLCKRKMPTLPTALLVARKHPHAKIDALIEYLKTLKVDGYNLSDGLVESEMIHRLREEGFFVNVYTVNNKLGQKELFAMGINGVFSDFCG